MSDKIKKYKVYIYEILFFAALLAVDLISKAVAFEFLEGCGGRYVVFDGIYELVEVHNDGASFGIFAGKTTALSVVTALAMVFLVGLLVWRPKSPKLFRYGLLAIIAGGIGNLVDRLAFGYVRDFIDYTFLETFFNIHNFGVGNIADIFVLVGLLCLVVYVFFGYKEGDFAKDGGHNDVDPDVLVVNEGEEQKKERVAEKDNVVSDAVNTGETESVSRVNTEGSGDCGKTQAADVSAAHKNTQEKAR